MNILRNCAFMLFSMTSLVALLPLPPQDQAFTSVLSQPQTIVDDKGVEMILIPAAEFQMGILFDNALELCMSLGKEADFCNPEFFEQFNWVSEPSIVSINEFYMDQYEVTNERYLDCVREDVCSIQPVIQEYYLLADKLEIKPNMPVAGITYYDAAVYCAWRRARIPTEAEWEYAASGPDKYSFSWGNDISNVPANYCDESCFRAEFPVSNDGFPDFAPVNTYEEGKSWVGVYNLSGNVSEWTSTRLLIGDGVGNDVRMVTGGNYNSRLYELAVWMRIPTEATIAQNNGFRCAKKVLTT